jgi:hypothetical protein
MKYDRATRLERNERTRQANHARLAALNDKPRTIMRGYAMMPRGPVSPETLFRSIATDPAPILKETETMVSGIEKPTSKLLATPIAVAFEFFCPDKSCGRDDPIPAIGGSFMWDRRPSVVTCPDCGQSFRVSLRIQS